MMKKTAEFLISFLLAFVLVTAVDYYTNGHDLRFTWMAAIISLILSIVILVLSVRRGMRKEASRREKLEARNQQRRQEELKEKIGNVRNR